jgi:hypothetical protein
MKKLCYIIVSILFVFPINALFIHKHTGSPPTVVSLTKPGIWLPVHGIRKHNEFNMRIAEVEILESSSNYSVYTRRYMV